jgi:hypothetical protein
MLLWFWYGILKLILVSLAHTITPSQCIELFKQFQPRFQHGIDLIFFNFRNNCKHNIKGLILMKIFKAYSIVGKVSLFGIMERLYKCCLNFVPLGLLIAKMTIP